MKQIGKVEKLEKQVPLELTDNHKNCHFELLSSLIYETTMNHFLIALSHVTKSEFYMTTVDDQFSGWTEKKV